MKFVMCGELEERACKHSAALFIVPNKFPWSPTMEDRSATITFIKIAGRTFAITCAEVVRALAALNNSSADELGYIFLAAPERLHVISKRFKIAAHDWTFPQPGIAIREVSALLPSDIGKIALDVDVHPVPPLREVSTAMAVGFPDRAKEPEAGPFGHRLSLPCLRAVTENRATGRMSLSLIGQIDDTQQTRDLSRMCGGPIYWSNEEKYGLLGIIYSSSQHLSTEYGPDSLHILGHLADKEMLHRWIAGVSVLY